MSALTFLSRVLMAARRRFAAQVGMAGVVGPAVMAVRRCLSRPAPVVIDLRVVVSIDGPAPDGPLPISGASEAGAVRPSGRGVGAGGRRVRDGSLDAPPSRRRHLRLVAPLPSETGEPGNETARPGNPTSEVGNDGTSRRDGAGRDDRGNRGWWR